jgi:hypothetical protein
MSPRCPLAASGTKLARHPASSPADKSAAPRLPPQVGFDNESTSTSRRTRSLEAPRGCEMHLTHIPTPGDEAGLSRLGVNLTSDPSFASKSLFVS